MAIAVVSSARFASFSSSRGFASPLSRLCNVFASVRRCHFKQVRHGMSGCRSLNSMHEKMPTPGKEQRTGTTRAATNPRAGGRPTQELAGRPRYFFNIDGVIKFFGASSRSQARVSQVQVVVVRGLASCFFLSRCFSCRAWCPFVLGFGLATCRRQYDSGRVVTLSRSPQRQV